MIKEDLKNLKLKRELKKIEHQLNNNKTNNSEFISNIINFIITNYNFFENITITQYSRFGFVISYIVYIKNVELISFDEKILPKYYNRHSINELVLSDINKKRHKKYKIKNNIKTLSEIDY